MEYTNIGFNPIFPLTYLFAIIAAIIIIYSIYIMRGGKARIMRFGLFFFIILMLFNPQIIKSNSTKMTNYVLVLNDVSPSMSAAKRDEGEKIIQKQLTDAISKTPNLQILEGAFNKSDGASLLKAIETLKSNINPQQISGAIIITDGQIDKLQSIEYPFPIHQLIVGSKNEKDLYIKLINRPIATEIGTNANIKLEIIDTSNSLKTTNLLVYYGDETPYQTIVKTNEVIDINIPVTKRGKVPLAFSVPAMNGEISTNNNALVTDIEGVNDKIRVLLVTGDPYEGLRAWRNLLKSDPNVDLVHFTILRSLEKDASASENEMSLIPFPTDELFSQSLDKFDLIVFDNFERIDALPDIYLQNIVDWVGKGGAFLMLAGVSEADNMGILNTPIAQILPITGPATIMEQPFKPQLTPEGLRNPITAPFKDAQANWGDWTRMLKIGANGNVLMTGNNAPLLITSHFENGRIAVIASDKSWLWQRGYMGGGPFRELFRRTAHWLMGEPSLENNILSMNADNSGININLQSEIDDNLLLNGGDINQSTKPEFNENRQFSIRYDNIKSGLYRAFYNKLSAYAILGGGDEVTEHDLRARDDLIKSANKRNAGNSFFLGIDGIQAIPKIMLKSKTSLPSFDSINLLDTEILSTNKITRSPLIPPIINALLFAILAIFMWWQEGRHKTR